MSVPVIGPRPSIRSLGFPTLFFSLVLFAAGWTTINAQERPAGEGAPSASAGTTEEGALALQQTGLADRYARLEKLLFDLSALEAAENPRRAALLRQAFQQSADKLTKRQLDTVAQLLVRRDYGRAVDEQGVALADLKQLLELLLSENRPDRLRNEQDRIREYIKELDRLIRLQGSVQGRTEGGVEVQRLAEEQARVAERAAELARRIQESEEPAGTEGKQGEGASGEESEGDGAGEGEADPSESPPGDSEPGSPSEGASGEGTPDEGKAGEGAESAESDSSGKSPESDSREKDSTQNDADPTEQGESTPSPGDSSEEGGERAEGAGPQEGDPGQPSEPGQGESEGEGTPGESSDESGESSDSGEPGSPGEPGPSGQQPSGEPGEGEAGESGEPSQADPSQNENPARKRIQAAEERMREAQRKLQEAKRSESLEEQEKAREELMKAKAELEEILRQMREEEVERMLSLLESRFRKMLEMQLKVYEATKRLDRIPKEERGRDFVVLANNLSSEERKITLEAERALLLLQEEGSSVAFPESVDQIRVEMERVAEMLGKGNVGLLAQEAEEEIIASLEEMIEALQQAQRDQEERQEQQPPGEQQQSSPEDPPLVDQLAELRMIRALQMRVNTRTERFSRLLVDADDPVGQAEDGELIEALEHLSDRERKIMRITRDILMEKNK